MRVNPTAAVEYADSAVNRSRQLGALVFLLVWSLVPAVACTLPDAEMTPAERACCVEMQRNCSGMDMPASHPCCQKQVRMDQTAVVQKGQHPLQLTTIQTLPGTPMVLPVSHVPGQHSLNVSPPQSPPSTIAILRI